MKQLAFELQFKATRGRELPMVERLQAIVRRKGIDIYERGQGKCQTGCVLVPPYLARPIGGYGHLCTAAAWLSRWPWIRCE